MKLLCKYIPENACNLVQDILLQHPIIITIVKHRNSKHGDFKKSTHGKVCITINRSLNQYQFLLTLIHEIAHFTTYKKYKRTKPHGKEWKQEFQLLMLPFLNPTIFPIEILPAMAKYLINPKASTGADVNLTFVLNQYNEKTDKSFIFELPLGSVFQYRSNYYKLGNKRRTRFECIALSSNRKYLFNQNTEIKILDTT
ncbi:SprT-like domain-containing protein [Lutibacter sp.]|uniref:SprT-like domain-containing protein n=1 Tax=Lutibacter sp. TaxID=1925666 RepID=UPI002734247C|nr:SprT-like domain-containing protein [Lutibacter sp.]MDP3313031.1 SprT-like domain-containing protein [Lutibacter sp.]